MNYAPLVLAKKHQRCAITSIGHSPMVKKSKQKQAP